MIGIRAWLWQRKHCAERCGPARENGELVVYACGRRGCRGSEFIAHAQG